MFQIAVRFQLMLLDKMLFTKYLLNEMKKIHTSELTHRWCHLLFAPGTLQCHLLNQVRLSFLWNLSHHVDLLIQSAQFFQEAQYRPFVLGECHFQQMHCLKSGFISTDGDNFAFLAVNQAVRKSQTHHHHVNKHADYTISHRWRKAGGRTLNLNRK